MNQYFGGEPMAVEDVIALFQSITLTDLHDRLLWARVFLRTEHPSKPFLTALVNDLYQLGYRVYAGEFEITVDLGKTRIHERVCLWSRMEDIRDRSEYFASDGIRVSPNDEITRADDVVSLVSQALSIRKAYQHGYKARSKEVQAALSGLMGVRLDQLGDDDD